jgi:intraflagellar transport protein 88
MDCKQEALEVYENVIQMDPVNQQCLEHLIKLATEIGLSAKADQYQAMLRDLVDRMEETNQEVYERGGRGPAGIGEGTNTMSGTTTANPIKFTLEKVESPRLKVDGTATDMVQTAVAVTGKDDIWARIADLDLGYFGAK